MLQRVAAIDCRGALFAVGVVARRCIAVVNR